MRQYVVKPTFICIDPDCSKRLSGHSSSLFPASFSHVTRESVVDTAGSSSDPNATASKGIGLVTNSYPERVSASSKNLADKQIPNMRATGGGRVCAMIKSTCTRHQTIKRETSQLSSRVQGYKQDTVTRCLFSQDCLHGTECLKSKDATKFGVELNPIICTSKLSYKTQQFVKTF